MCFLQASVTSPVETSKVLISPTPNYRCIHPKKKNKKVIKSLNFYDAHLVNDIYKMTNSINVVSLVLSYLSFLLSQKVLNCYLLQGINRYNFYSFFHFSFILS